MGGRTFAIGDIHGDLEALYKVLSCFPALTEQDTIVFVGDYLTTKGQAPEADYKMIEEMGFTITGDPTSSAAASCSTGGAS